MNSAALNNALQFLIDNGVTSRDYSYALISGSGLANGIDKYADIVDRFSYNDIPGMPLTTVSGHSGELLAIKSIDSNELSLVFSGRIHLYEGASLDDILFQVRLANLLNIKRIIITCAVGSINRFSPPGSLGIITDHVDMQFFGEISINDISSGFKRIYDVDLINKLKKTAIKHRIPIVKGVLCSVMGPTFETPAEVSMARLSGADWMSMSTVKEAAEAYRLGMRLAGIVGVANFVNAQNITHEEVIESARICSDKLWMLLSKMGE